MRGRHSLEQMGRDGPLPEGPPAGKLLPISSTARETPAEHWGPGEVCGQHTLLLPRPVATGGWAKELAELCGTGLARGAPGLAAHAG